MSSRGGNSQKHLNTSPFKVSFTWQSDCVGESQHLQARRIQRLNSKFILVRIRNTDHVLRVRWDHNPLTEIWQWWFVVIGRGGSGRDYVLQCAVKKIGGEQWLFKAEQHWPFQWQTTGRPHISVCVVYTAPISKFSTCSKNLSYWKPINFCWNEKQKAQWFSTHSCL